MDIYNQFTNVVFDSRGNISPVKFRKEYFIKQNKQPLWDWFEEQQQIFEGYSNREILLLISNGYTISPKCIVCGNTAKIQVYSGKSNFSVDYCSLECSHKSNKRKIKISETKKNYTKERLDEIEEKRKRTNLEKYGVEYQSKRQEVKEIISEKLSKHQIGAKRNNLLDRDWLNEEYNVKKRTALDIADEVEVYYGTVIEYCKKHGFKIRRSSNNSLPQKKIYEFICSIYDGEVLYNDWDILGNLELDIYIPELKIAIEHNGLPSHSANPDTKKNKTRHLEKTKRCEELGINLLHIRGDQWINKKNIVKSMIQNKLGLTNNKIYARKCEIKTLSIKEARDFFNETHIQGYCGSSIKLGLFYNGELVSAILCSKPRYNRQYVWELIRFSNKLNTSVIGGFSKLLKHFRKNHQGRMISYCDRSRSQGNVYRKNGFSLILESESGYYWTDNHTVYHRTNFQKHKLENKLKSFDPLLTEKINMFNNGYRIIYDCGELVFGME